MDHFPIEVKQYEVSIHKDSAEIRLFGDVEVEGAGAAPGNVIPGHNRGIIRFDDRDLEDRWEPRTRKVLMWRPLAMFPGILDLLRNEKPLFLDKDGTLSTSSEPAGEKEDQPA